MDIQSNKGDVNVKAVYAGKTSVSSRAGNVIVGTCHGDTSVNIESGNLCIGE